MNVAICTPTTGSVKASYTASLMAVVTYYLNHPVPGRENEERSLSYNLLIGSNIAQQRESLVEDALSDPTTTHVLFIDDDMGAKQECLNLALSRKQPIVLANYRRKAPPWAFTCRKMNEGRAIEVITNEESTGLELVSFGGFGFCLIEVGVLKELDAPAVPQSVDRAPGSVQHRGLPVLPGDPRQRDSAGTGGP